MHQRTKMLAHFSDLIDFGLNLRKDNDPLKKPFLEALNDLLRQLVDLNNRILYMKGKESHKLHC